jgi:hypothetical protein
VIARDFPVGRKAALRSDLPAGNDVVLFVAASLTTLAEMAATQAYIR